MFTLIIGGAASGKSEYAEALVMAQPEPRLYIATMQPYDDECVARISRHRAMRAQKGFTTVERYTSLAGAALPVGGSALLEDLSNLLANELYSPEGRGAGQVMAGIEAVLDLSANLTVVTNEVFSGGAAYSEETLRFLQELAGLNRALAARADNVIEVVCGFPNVLKGVGR